MSSSPRGGPEDWTFVKRQEAGIAEPQLGNHADVGVGDPRQPDGARDRRPRGGRPRLQFPQYLPSPPTVFWVGG